MSGGLHLKYRPGELDGVSGNLSTVASLKEVLDRSREEIPHALMFTGPSGCGKTTLARIVKDALGCISFNFFEYNVANVRGIDTVRGIIENCRLAAMGGGVRVYLLDEAHQLTKDAQNALLKILEDTPGHVYFLLCTTDPEKVIKTIRTRCMIFPVTLLPTRFLRGLLRGVAKAEGLDFDSELFKLIADVSEGSPRQALVLLDQVRGLTKEAAKEAVVDATVSETKLSEVCQLLLAKRTEKWSHMKGLAAGLRGEDVERFRRGVLAYMATVLLGRSSGDDVAQIMDCFLESTFASGYPGLLTQLYYASKVI